MEKTYELEVINAISSEFHTVGLIYGKDFSMRLYRVTEGSSFFEKVRNNTIFASYEELMRTSVNKVVIPEERDYVLLKTSIAEVKKNSKENVLSRIDYRRLEPDGSYSHHQMAFTKVVSADGKENYILAARNVDNIFREQEKHQKQLADYYSLIQALSYEYDSVYYLKFSEDAVIPIRLNAYIESNYGDFFRSKPTYKAAFSAYVNNSVYEPDRVELLEKASLENIVKALENKRSFELEYRSKRDGELHYFNMKVVKQECNGKMEGIIFGFADVNDQKVRWERLLRNSLTDELTGLKNRRAYAEDIQDFDEMLKKKTVGNISAISVDANGLKKANDTLGHIAGDEIIKGIADCMTEVFNKNTCGRDCVYRMGGDEFFVVLQCPKEKVEALLLELNKTVKKWHGKLVDSISISCGYAHSEDNPEVNVAQLVKLADDFMYKEKSEYYVRTGLDRRRS
ncbi:MAG: GGDEF domain-containing protein [Treponema sp.]|nr:GGDEF domain-containing protein [Treponema sp.]